MSAFQDILTAHSKEIYNSWQQSYVLADVYQLVSVGDSTYSVLAQIFNSTDQVIDSVYLNVTVPADDWLNEYVTQLNEESANEGEDVATSTETTAELSE